MSAGHASRRDVGGGATPAARHVAQAGHAMAGAGPSCTPLTLRVPSESEPACAMCGGPWRELGHCKGVCLRCGFMQSCVDTV